jgi:ketosteroid isomerase-like protein
LDFWSERADAGGVTTTDPLVAAELAATYFDAWRSKDFATLRSILADDVTFVGPMGTADGADECVQGMQQLARIMTDVVVRKRFVAGDDVLTWFELVTDMAPPCPVANWSHTEGGRIRSIRVTFDPRPLLPS